MRVFRKSPMVKAAPQTEPGPPHDNQVFIAGHCHSSGAAMPPCVEMRSAWPGSGLSTRSAHKLPHDEVRDGPRYVSKRNSPLDDCSAHIAVDLMSHVPVDAPAALQAADLLASAYMAITCCFTWLTLACSSPPQTAARSATLRAEPPPASERRPHSPA